MKVAYTSFILKFQNTQFIWSLMFSSNTIMDLKTFETVPHIILPNERFRQSIMNALFETGYEPRKLPNAVAIAVDRKIEG